MPILFSSPLAFIFFICFVVGGSILLIQLGMMLLGFGGELDGVDGIDGLDGAADLDHDLGDGGAGLFKVLSLRTAVAGLTFFGLGGLAGVTGKFGNQLSIVFALVGGLLAIFVVYYLYRSISRLKSDGTVSDASLVGSRGTVYIKIPGENAGRGKVLVSQQDRTMEYEATTPGPELANGMPIVVVKIVSPNVVEVQENKL